MVDSPTTSAKAVPVNTTAMVIENSMLTIADVLSYGSPTKFIEAQEAQGQRSLVQSETLPVDIIDGKKEDLEKSGIKFLGEVPGDELFQFVELPEGWNIKATNHSMWSKLFDDKGRERASIFYKGAFYDRAAHLSIKRRYNVQTDNEGYEKRYGICLDDCTEIHRTEAIACDREILALDAREKAKQLAEAWLNDNYPNWRDRSAYWD